VAILDRRWRCDGPAADACDTRLEQLATVLVERGGLIVAVTALPVRAGHPDPKWRLDSEGSIPPFGGRVAADVVVEAGGTSAFYASTLDDVLRRAGRSDLVIAGWGLEGPVHSTLRAANDRGFECLLVADASSAIDPTLIHASSEMVRFSGGIFGACASTNDVLATFGEPTDA
jgi:hypothetical protein